MGIKTEAQVQRAFELLDFLESHPDKHDQSTWISAMPWSAALDPVDKAAALADCETTACAAGWTCLLAGYRFVSGVTVEIREGDIPPFTLTAEDAATELLGLSGAERSKLFHSAQNLYDVRYAIKAIFGPRPVSV